MLSSLETAVQDSRAAAKDMRIMIVAGGNIAAPPPPPSHPVDHGAGHR